MRYSRFFLAKLFAVAWTSLHAQCGFLAGNVTEITGTVPVVASISVKTDQGKVRLGKTDSSGVFNVEMPCNVSVITIEASKHQSLHIPLNADSKLEGTYFVTFALMPLGKQTSDEPYAQSEQTHFELKDTTKAQTSIIRRFEVKDAMSNQALPAEICLYYTQKQKKDCINLLVSKPSAEIIFTEKDIVAMEVKSAGYQAYNGNLILDKTDQEPRTYIIKLNKQHSMLSVNIINASSGVQFQLLEENNSAVPLHRVNDGHYFAEVAPGKSYNLGVGGANQKEFSTAVASLKEGLTLKSLRIPERETPVAIAEKPINRKGIVASGKTLYFPRSDYKLPVQSRTYLDSVASYILENRDKALRITGHTDNVGNPGLNVTLSEYRVRVITKYLMNKGVPESAITASGVGSKHPVVPNDTEENRRKNRRVEVQIIDLQEKSN
ncbi:OmpA family protein [Dyadobacter arcticus]|uniref:Outer membrane protein OmpA-like peptidoglycan-associated protein n=1 Tax=Dyadobacter arcticus TaxID=1078754 RepID=A0ABX0UIE2_9BACT|nr:OmpA family protein [Dyadobacter arcticus]NIJ51155.1 outer membrane protein OmpA-like peptidoglycan-associated protein [Dyadobacter arcticus]